MQSAPITPTTSEINEKSPSLEGVLYALPQELLGVIPENVWQGLSLEQKKDILRQNDIFEKYLSSENNEVSQVPAEEQVIQGQEVVVEQAQRPQEAVRTPEFAEVVKEVESIERDLEEQKPSQDEQARVEAETLTTQNAAKNSWGAKVFGYTMSDDLTQNAENVSANGDLEDGRTWAATLIRKIFAMFGQ